MKMNNKFLTAALGVIFLCAGTLATSAQKFVDYTKDASNLALGDTVVMIDGNPSHYLTGEKIPKWVYTKRHTVMQLGTKRFPNGVLLREIYSWVDLNYVYRAKETKEEQKPVVDQKAETKQPADNQPVKPDTTEPVEPTDNGQAQQGGETAETQPADNGNKDENEGKEGEDESKGDEVAAVPAFQRFSIGLRGGAASLMQDVKGSELGSWKLGYNAALDLQYAYYFARKKHPERATRHGILVDLSAAFTHSDLAGTVDSTYTEANFHGTGKDVIYDVFAENVKEHDSQLQVELALMYSLLHKGFFFNIGPKVIMPLYNPFKLSAQNWDITATLPEGVKVVNEPVTGRLDEFVPSAKKWNSSKVNIALAADLGYEFKLRNGHALGLGVYADYNFKDFGFKPAEDGTYSLVKVEPVASQPADVTVLPLTNTYAKGLNGFDAGVKVVYHFNFPKQY